MEEDGDTDELAEDDGDTDELGLILGLSLLLGDTLELGETLGLSELLGLTLALGETLGLTELLGLADELGDPPAASAQTVNIRSLAEVADHEPANVDAFPSCVGLELSLLTTSEFELSPPVNSTTIT